MATATATVYSNRYPVPAGGPGARAFVVKATTVAATMATNDILKILALPSKGITIYDAFVQCADLDTNATPAVVFSLRVTNGTTTKTIISLSTVGQAGGLIRPTKITSTEDGVGFVTDDDNYYIDALWTTGAATAASAAFYVGLVLDGFYAAGAVTE